MNLTLENQVVSLNVLLTLNNLQAYKNILSHTKSMRYRLRSISIDFAIARAVSRSTRHR